MKNSRGFSLIELLIVVVIIGIIAAIAIPNLISARRSSNEASALSALRTAYGANMSFAATVGRGRYAGTAGTVDASSLAELHTANFVDDVLGRGSKSGYAFVGDSVIATPTVPATFYFAANPQVPSGIMTTGMKRFGLQTDGVLKADATLATLGTPFDAASLATATPFNSQ